VPEWYWTASVAGTDGCSSRPPALGRGSETAPVVLAVIHDLSDPKKGEGVAPVANGPRNLPAAWLSTSNAG
jgi:hypothetical protein